jgi:hypothetical protein
VTERKRNHLQDPLDQSLAPLGYSRIETNLIEWGDIHRPSVFKAEWGSPDVEHFLYLGTDIKRHKYLAGKFGLRSPTAEAYSIAGLLKYGHPNFKRWASQLDREIGCAISFGLDRFDLASRQYARIAVAVGKDELAQHITALVRDRLRPVIQDVADPAGHLQLLASDIEPYVWIATNPIIRAAQIVAIGCQLALPRQMIQHMLSPHHHLIATNLVEPELKSSVDTFVDRLIDDLTHGAACRTG